MYTIFIIIGFIILVCNVLFVQYHFTRMKEKDRVIDKGNEIIDKLNITRIEQNKRIIELKKELSNK